MCPTTQLLAVPPFISSLPMTATFFNTQIRIVNKRTYLPQPNIEHLISIDRSTPLGNPFHMFKEADRDLVCDQYEEYFYKTLAENTNKSFIYALNNIITTLQMTNVALGCWCYPKRCHGETIIKWIEEKR